MRALAPARQTAYAFFAAAFNEPPSKALLETLCAGELLGTAEELFGEAALAAQRQYAACAEDTAKRHEEARQEFMNLFKVPGGQYVTPYESVYRDSREIAGQKVRGLLMGQSAVDVQKWYRLAALEISPEYKDLPDHIALQLGYLAYLCAKEQEFASSGDDARLTRTWEMQRDFLAAHVVSWITALRDRIHEQSQHAYFRVFSDMAVDFTQRDLATMENLLGPSSGKPAPQYEAIAS